MEKPFLTVIIPTLNEGKRISKNLDNYLNYLKKQDYTSEVVIADSYSTDDTVKIAQDKKKDFPNLRVLDVPKGKGNGIKAAMLDAKGQYRMFLDADGATPINELDDFIPYTKEGFDVLIGSRFKKSPKARVKRTFVRKVLGKMANLAFQILIYWGIQDNQCGFKMFSEKASNIIFNILKIGGWGFDMEMLAIAKVYKLKLKEIPVSWYEVGGGGIGTSAYIQSLKDLFIIFGRRITRAYSLKNNSQVKKYVEEK